VECGCRVHSQVDGFLAVENCPLHAAAPELLEAAKSATAYYEMLERSTGVEHGVLKKLRAAISKSTKGA
jgi:hypothetical protein